MRTSRLLLATQKEDPAEAEIVSHRLMLRAAVMERCYSMREGYVPERDDLLPDRFFDETILNKYGQPKALDREVFLKERRRIYRSYGLADDGRPTEAFLNELDLGFTVPALKNKLG